MEVILSKTYISDQELANDFETLPKTKYFFESMRKLNTITPLLTNAKTTNLDAINEIENFFYYDEPNLTIIAHDAAIKLGDRKKINIGTIPCIISHYDKIEKRISFRIIFFDDSESSDNATLQQNSYKIKNNEDINDISKGYLYAFSNDIMNDTYINAIIKILSQRHIASNNFSDNYITFFVKNEGYQIKNFSETNLTNFIDTLEINREVITDILKNVLAFLSTLKTNEYGFVHGNLVTDNIYVNIDRDNNYFYQIGNFHDSSIFYNGIRFANRNNINNKILYNINDGYYRAPEKIKSYIPMHGSHDIYVFMLSLLEKESIFNFFKKDQDFFRNIYGELFSENEIEILLSKLTEKQRVLQQIIENEDFSKIKNEKEFINDMIILNYDDFKKKHKNINSLIFYDKYYRKKSPIFKLVTQFYDTKKYLEISNFNLKLNIDGFYDKIIGTNPTTLDLDNSDLPYKRFPNRYFQLSLKGFNGEYHLCLSGCKNNLDIPEAQKNTICRTNRYSKTGITLTKKYYDWDYCKPDVNVYEMSQYKILSRLLSYYRLDGTIDNSKLNNDPYWKILLNMIIDTKLLIPYFDCSNDFIIRSNILPVNSASRSRQFVDVDLGNIYETLNLHHNNLAIDEFIDNISIETNEKYMMKPALLNLIKDVLSKLRKQAFAKVNGLSDGKYVTDIFNAYINNEQKIYQLTDKLLYNNYTPNISSLLIHAECKVEDADIYYNHLVKYTDNFGNTYQDRMGDYFNDTIKINSSSLQSLYSFKIFLLELLKGSIELDKLIEQNIAKIDDDSFVFNFYAIIIQIAYTLECFYRIGLVHNDLHTGNVFVEYLPAPVNFKYILTDDSGERIIKIINIRTRYFVRIFDFDRSYTYPKNHKYLTIKVDKIYKVSEIPSENDYSASPLARKYDFSYVCRWIAYIFGNTISKGRIKDMIRDIVGDYAYGLHRPPVYYKSQPEIEVRATYESVTPFEWLTSLDIDNEIIKTNFDITNLKIEDDSYIFILPDASTEYLSNEFKKNNDWSGKSIDQKINICSPIIKNFDSHHIIDKLNILCRTKIAQLDIDWVRHGESCANLDQKINVDLDEYPNRPFGYDKYNYSNNKEHLAPVKNKMGIDTKLKAGWKYEPNLSYIGMQQAILLGTNFISTQPPYNIIICSPLTRTIMTAMLASRNIPGAIVHVVPYISEIQNVFQYIGSDYQNIAVNSKTLKQRILFIKDWLENNWINNFDDIEIMEDLIKIREYLLDNGVDKEEHLIVQIGKALTCKPSIGKTAKNEFENKYSECENIINLVSDVVELLNKRGITDNIFYQKYHMHTIDNFKMFKRGAPVNFKILEKYESIYSQKIKNKDVDAEQYNTRNPNIYKFYTEILPEIVDLSIPNKILCVAHGSLIRKIWLTKNPKSFNDNKTHLKHMKNTNVFRETINYDKSTFKAVYDPQLIRTSYENFEFLNIDVCRTQSIKGIINFNLREPSKSFGKTLKGYVISDIMPLSKMSYDVQFYDDDVYKNNKIPNIIVGGNNNDPYYKKYLKYKSKYFGLKNQITIN
ncbi:hypothetical protein QJ857_gp0431 [Tupanvirus soda lake]|uniref:Protein kinase domain-containing protein n=2 Tax=Tupanvirus TaxID=2094720 RepID=A0A6N1NMD3_9VIRU|nr:hypothetical protein QJ857_gp0431 [Tupanvirus soda lake]QKU35604.1 hypothetical protein [Tupanvirus soda lake]